MQDDAPPRRDGDGAAYRRGAVTSSRGDASSPGEGQALTPLPAVPGDDSFADELEDVASTPARFGQLAVYAVACLLCSFDWNIMAPIYSIGEKRFHVGLQRINSLSNAWNIYSAPGALLALWVTERYGLRKSLLWGYASGVACALLSHLACTAPLAPSAAFSLLYFSQVLGAVGQPLFLNNVTLFAGTWFPASERDAAVAVSLLCVAAGTVFISILAPAVVTTPAQVDRVFAFQVPLWVATLLAGLMFTAEEPPQPPSASAAVMRAERRRAQAAGGGRDESGMAALRHAVAQAQALCASSSFMMLNFSSSILTGLVYLLATVVGQLFSPCGDTDTEAGAALAALAALSCVGVLVYLLMLQRAEPGEQQQSGGQKHAVETAPHAYRAHQVAWSGAACLGMAIVLATERAGVSPAMLVAAWGALGLFSGTLLNGALTMEHAAELSFPVPPNVSVALLGITSSFVSFGQVLVGTALLASSRSSDCSSVFTPFAAFCAASAVLGMALLALLQPQYRRAEAEARVQAAADAKAQRLRDAQGKGAYGAMA